MTAATRALAWALTLALSLAACGSRVAPDPEGMAAAEDGSGVARAPAGEPPADTAGQPGEEPGADAQAEAGGQPGTAAPPGQGAGPAPARRSVPVDVRVSPACVSPGSILTVVFQTHRPGSHMAMSVAYSDHATHGSFGFGQADDSGSFSWPVPIPVDAPAGPAVVMVSASGDGQDVGLGDGQFQVAAPGGCPS